MEISQRFQVAADLITISRLSEKEKADARSRLMAMAIDRAHDCRHLKNDRKDKEEEIAEYVYLTFRDYSLLKVAITEQYQPRHFSAYSRYPRDDYD